MKQKSLIIRISAVLFSAFLMTSFVAYRSGAFDLAQNEHANSEQGLSDTIHKKDTLLLAEYIVIVDSGFYTPPYMYTSKAMIVDDRPKFVGAYRDTVRYGTARADSIMLSKNPIKEPYYMGGSKSGPVFSPGQTDEPLLISPEKSGKKKKVKNKK